jgi:hypothetical protein
VPRRTLASSLSGCRSAIEPAALILIREPGTPCPDDILADVREEVDCLRKRYTDGRP